MAIYLLTKHVSIYLDQIMIIRRANIVFGHTCTTCILLVKMSTVVKTINNFFSEG
jgi:hypothetical protein